MPSGSGGARVRSGPPPDADAFRRDRKDDQASWTTLPIEGRRGKKPPPWPLLDQSDREKQLWPIFWAKPQAVIWERDHVVEAVAMYVRQFCEGEIPKSSAENRKTIRMMGADLYLTPDSLLKARLRIATDEVEAKRAARTPAKKTAAAATRSSARDRLKVVPSGRRTRA